MIKLFRALLSLVLMTIFCGAPPVWADVTLRAKTEESAEPLTTEKIWKLDPLELNPHRKNWLLARDLKAIGLKPKMLSAKNRYGVTLDAIEAETRILKRPSGPWYRSLSDYGCKSEPNSWFATLQGTHAAAEAGAKFWNSLLEQRLDRLSLLLARINEPSPDKARSEAQRVFMDWQLDLESEWQNQGEAAARAAELKFYKQQIARHKASGQPTPCLATGFSGPSWNELMEPVPAQVAPPGKEKFLARLPAKRWNGLYTIRLSLDIGDKRLNGQFLLDSGSLRSFVAPEFLAGQGIPPQAVVLKNIRPQKIRRSGGTAVASAVGGIHLFLGNQPIPFRDLLMTEAEIFYPPQFVGTCCDGVLGIDFMMQYAVEFRAGPPTEVVIWPREGFHHEPTRPWTEVSTTSRGDLISATCLAYPSTDAAGKLKEKSAMTPIVGARWDTGSQRALEMRATRLKSSSTWDLRCGNHLLVKKAVASPLNREGDQFSQDTIVNVGMPVLGRGSMTLDLGHGRIWFTEETLRSPVRRNESGLTVRFRYDEARGGERYLNVESIATGTPASRAAKSAGLKPGVQIAVINGQSTAKMDLWTVNQHLAGAYGDSVQLEWKAGKNQKVAVILLK